MKAGTGAAGAYVAINDPVQLAGCHTGLNRGFQFFKSARDDFACTSDLVEFSLTIDPNHTRSYSSTPRMAAVTSSYLLVAVYVIQKTALLVILNQRQSTFLVDIQAMAYGFLVVILALADYSTTLVTTLGYLSHQTVVICPANTAGVARTSTDVSPSQGPQSIAKHGVQRMPDTCQQSHPAPQPEANRARKNHRE